MVAGRVRLPAGVMLYSNTEGGTTMARVYTQTARKSKYERRCTGCGEPIEPGQQCYNWSPRLSGKRFRHVSCGYPRPTELSNRKTAVVQEAAEDAQTAISEWSPELPEVDENTTELELDCSDLESVLEDVATQAEDVAQEYEDGVSNMPDALQYSPTAEAMNEVAEELRSWADDLRSPDFETTVYGEGPEGETDWQQAWDDALDAARSAAEDKLGDVPEYQG